MELSDIGKEVIIKLKHQCLGYKNKEVVTIKQPSGINRHLETATSR